jgi:PIN domain nuclease of toxin-antitoxin system
LKLLLDTHALLWFYLDDPKLSDAARLIILDPANVKLVSPASYWEIAIKVSLGKYILTKPHAEAMHDAIDRNGFGVLPIEPTHTATLATLPFHHRDPFDRLIIAQALTEGLAIVGADTQFDAYGVTRYW